MGKSLDPQVERLHTMQRTSWLVGLLVAMFSLNATAAGLDLRQGTRAFGGSISDTLNTTTDVHSLRVAPVFGYFVAENIE